MNDNFFSEFKNAMLARAPRIERGTAARKQPVIHDFTFHAWGHYCGIIANKIKKPSRLTPWKKPQERVTMTCALGLGVKKGDLILLKMKSGKTGRFIVESVKYANDPRDMFSALLLPDGYHSEP